LFTIFISLKIHSFLEDLFWKTKGQRALQSGPNRGVAYTLYKIQLSIVSILLADTISSKIPEGTLWNWSIDITGFDAPRFILTRLRYHKPPKCKARGVVDGGGDKTTPYPIGREFPEF
jgi:hypothetical protein